MTKFPLCGDSLLIIFMGGSLMTVFGIAMVGINRKAQHQVSNLVYALEILTILPILCWRVYESCREVEQMHEYVLLVQAAVTVQEPSASPTSQQDTRWWDFLSKYFRENPSAVNKVNDAIVEQDEALSTRETEYNISALKESTPNETSVKTAECYVPPFPDAFRELIVEQDEALSARETEYNISALKESTPKETSVKTAECYIPPFPDAFRELIDSYEYDGERVDMASPTRCSYSKKTKWDHSQNGIVPEETVILGKEVPRMQNANSSSYTPMPVEYRAITTYQMRAIKANINRRCEKEGWLREWNGERTLLTPEIVNLYDIDKYIVKPFTKDSRASFVETLPSTCGTQNPHLFLSHWWGEPLFHTLDCIEQLIKDFSRNFEDSHDARGGGMTIHTPIWICIFANNQWRINEELGKDSNPMKSPFGKAMRESKGTISILDASGIVFTRAWCILELFMTLTAKKKDEDDADVKNRDIWGVYTAHKHAYKPLYSDPEERSAVGIISGGAPGESSYYTSLRERHFPLELIQLSHKIDIKSAQASEVDDLKHILNSIAETDDLEADPHTNHANYVKLNDAVKGAFAASTPALKAAAAAGGDEWTGTLNRLSKGVMTGRFDIDFSLFDPCLSSTQARELVSHVPSTCDGLYLVGANKEVGEGAIEGMIEWIGKAKTIKWLGCQSCKVDHWWWGGRDAGIRLAAALEASEHATSIEVLYIQHTDLISSAIVSEWAYTLRKMTALKKLYLSGVRDYISDKEKSILSDATHASKVLEFE